ncbi:MAG TPA: hypothetical protein VHV29_01410, partial [Terriglobales bacterium]|nr:hypothetical protein [Terriglobales bacterium]
QDRYSKRLSSPHHVVSERFQYLVFELILHQRIKVIAGEFPGSGVMTGGPQIERVSRRIADVARLRAHDQSLVLVATVVTK